MAVVGEWSHALDNKASAAPACATVVMDSTRSVMGGGLDVFHDWRSCMDVEDLPACPRTVAGPTHSTTEAGVPPASATLGTGATNTTTETGWMYQDGCRPQHVRRRCCWKPPSTGASGLDVIHHSKKSFQNMLVFEDIDHFPTIWHGRNSTILASSECGNSTVFPRPANVLEPNAQQQEHVPHLQMQLRARVPHTSQQERIEHTPLQLERLPKRVPHSGFRVELGVRQPHQVPPHYCPSGRCRPRCLASCCRRCRRACGSFPANLALHLKHLDVRDVGDSLHGLQLWNLDRVYRFLPSYTKNIDFLHGLQL